MRKSDDVRKYVVRREVKKGDKTFYKSPKIQRLITERRIRRKKLVKRAKLDGFKKTKEDKAKYDKVLSKYIKERKAHAHPEAVVPAKEEKKAPVAAPKPKKNDAPAPKVAAKEAPKVAAAKKPAQKSQKK